MSISSNREDNKIILDQKDTEDEKFNQEYIYLLITSKNDFSKFSEINDFKDLFFDNIRLKRFFVF